MVSVIVPVYNSEKFLSRCIKSLVNQTLKEIEIIFVNDVSTDESLEIIKKFKEKYPKKIKIINSKKKLRQGGARNLGIKVAIGEYVAFVDSDDWVNLNMFSLLYKKAKQDESDFVGCRYFVSDSQKNIIEKNKFSKFLLEISGKILNDKEKERLLFSISALWCHIYRRSIIFDKNIFFIENIAYEDNHFVRLYTLYIQKYSFLDIPLYFYFENLNSTTRQKNQNYQFDRLLVEKKKIEAYKARSFYERYKNGIEIDFVRTFYINTVAIIFNSFDNPPVEKIKNLKNEVKKFFPKYKLNPYYNEIIPTLDKIKIVLAENFPLLLNMLYKFKIYVKSHKRKKINEKN
ncbi:MAG: glycosyltransferase [Oscillospiraceae bacterium]|jgi:glycosyltransferase involved in cell wall biosynthesis|nr:glycosyltransferase [Oscillospiraceae bacterium]